MAKFQIPNPESKIAIVGAGPAGASSAIRLAKKDFRVILIERERFPRPKLCGEFISPECFRHFRELGVFNEMLAAGGGQIVKTVFYSPNGKSIAVPSEWFNKNESGALSLSRAEMDFRLLERARKIGVEVLEESPVVGLSSQLNKIKSIKLRMRNGDAKEIFADLFIDATGRARVLGKLAEREFHHRNAETQRDKIPNPKPQISNRLVGFKAHLENARTESGACEIYFFRGGYGGLSFVENGLANFCFLIRAETVKEYSGDVRKIIKEVVFQNEQARNALKRAAPVHDWLAVTVDGFGAKELNPAKNLFAVGDAGAFIDPFTGSGMLTAFESAELLASAMAENTVAEKIAAQYKSAHARKFRRRLFVCSVMRRAAFAPRLAENLISVLSLSDAPRKLLARATRWREVKDEK
jgi:menaquinone-9 beta-reductase